MPPRILRTGHIAIQAFGENTVVRLPQHPDQGDIAIEMNCIS